jgi:hypothetical protein
MGNLFNFGKKPGGGITGGGSGGGTGVKNPVTGSSGEFADDGATRMPVINSKTSIEAGRRQRREIAARSGRSSTRMVSEAGTRAYVGSLLGNG